MIHFKNSSGKIVMTEKDNGEIVMHDMKITEEKKDEKEEKEDENSDGN